jgi:hypothetical protein
MLMALLRRGGTAAFRQGFGITHRRLVADNRPTLVNSRCRPPMRRSRASASRQANYGDAGNSCIAKEILVAPIGPDIRRNIVTDAQKPPVVLTKGAIKPRKCLVKIVTHGVLPVMSSRIICAPES